MVRRCARLGNGTAPKRPEKVQKSAFFDPSNRFTSVRQGCGAPQGASKGTRTGEISCCGCGPEPVTGFVGVCSVLLRLLLSSRYRALRHTPRLTPILSSTAIPATCCTRPILTHG